MSLLLMHTLSAEESSHTWSCLSNNTVNTKSISLNNLPYNTNFKSVNIYIHILRDDDATGGLSLTDVNSTLEILKQDYEKANITLLEIGREYINDSEYKYCTYTQEHFNDLIAINSHINAIDIYILPETNPIFKSDGIPGSAVVFGGFKKNTSIISHELGHCFGLYYTHSGTGCDDYANSMEAIDGSNSLTSGDLVSDTPADPCLIGNVDEDCNYIGGGEYNPDTKNIMSYTDCNCLMHFTPGQVDRMHNILTNSNLLQATQTSISGSSKLCLSGDSCYTINNLPSGSTISWSSSELITRTSPQGANPCFFTASESLEPQDSLSINATITTATCSYTIHKTVHIGKQAPALYIYDNNQDESLNGKTNQEYYCTASGEDYSEDNTTYSWTITDPKGNITTSTHGIEYFFTPTETGEYTISINYGTNETIKMESKRFNVLNSPRFEIHPNPASSSMNLKLNNYSDSDAAMSSFNYAIMDQTTKIHRTGRTSAEKTNIDVSDLKNGIYFVVLTTETNNYVEKLIIE